AERQLLERPTGHRVFQTIGTLGEEELLAVLLQRRFISMIFVPIYDMAIDALSDPSAITVVRQILREEYPGQHGTTPSHREDLVHDLLLLGATKDQILASRPSPATTSIIEDTLRLMYAAGSSTSRDIEVLAMLRFWG